MEAASGSFIIGQPVLQRMSYEEKRASHDHLTMRASYRDGDVTHVAVGTTPFSSLGAPQARSPPPQLFDWLPDGTFVARRICAHVSDVARAFQCAYDFCWQGANIIVVCCDGTLALWTVFDAKAPVVVNWLGARNITAVSACQRDWVALVAQEHARAYKAFVQLYDTATGLPVLAIPVNYPQPHPTVWSTTSSLVRLAPDGATIAVAKQHGAVSVTLYDSTGRELGPLLTTAWLEARWPARYFYVFDVLWVNGGWMVRVTGALLWIGGVAVEPEVVPDGDIVTTMAPCGTGGLLGASFRHMPGARGPGITLTVVETVSQRQMASMSQARVAWLACAVRASMAVCKPAP